MINVYRKASKPSHLERSRKIHVESFCALLVLIGPIDNLPLVNIQWVIVGGESGPKSRPLEVGWVTSIQRQCQEAHVPFFFKQWGGTNKKKAGRNLEGETYDEMPTGLTRVLVK